MCHPPLTRSLNAAVDVRRAHWTLSRPRRGHGMLVVVPRWSVLLFVVVFAAIAALVVANRERDDDRALPAPAPPRAAPEPARGPEAHLRALQRIADEHGGTRSAGSPGDAATAEYVEAAPAGGRVPRVAAALQRAGLPRDLAAAAARRRPHRAPDPHAPVLARRHGVRTVSAPPVSAARTTTSARCRRARSRWSSAGRASSATRRSTPSGPAPPRRSSSTRSASRSRPRSSAPGSGSPCSRSGRRPARGSRAARRP